MKSFRFNTRGRDCMDFGISCISANVFDYVKDKFNTIEVLGSYSPLLQFMNTQGRFILKIQVVIQSQDIYATMSNIYSWLGNDHSDSPIYLSNCNECYWEGFFEEITSIQDYNDTHIVAILHFNCKPLKQLKSGDVGLKFSMKTGDSNSITASRITAPSKPTIVVPLSTELDTLTINVSSAQAQNQIMELKGLKALPPTKKLILSSELQECYYIDDTKNLVPCNHLTKGDYPETYSGNFEISVTNLTDLQTIDLEIYPRWRVR